MYHFTKVFFFAQLFLIFHAVYSQQDKKNKRQYDVQLLNVEQSNKGNEYIYWKFEVDEYNSTINVMNGIINIMENIPLHAMINVKGYEKRGNEYFLALVDATMNICEFLKEDLVKKIFLARSNFPKNCQVSKGNYTVENMIISSDDLPEKITGRYWMMNFILLIEDNIIEELEIYIRVDYKNKIKNIKV